MTASRFEALVVTFIIFITLVFGILFFSKPSSSQVRTTIDLNESLNESNEIYTDEDPEAIETFIELPKNVWC